MISPINSLRYSIVTNKNKSSISTGIPNESFNVNFQSKYKYKRSSLNRAMMLIKAIIAFAFTSNIVNNICPDIKENDNKTT